MHDRRNTGQRDAGKVDRGQEEAGMEGIRKGGTQDRWVAGQADKGKDAGEERWTRGKIQDRRKQEKKEAGKEWRSK